MIGMQYHNNLQGKGELEVASGFESLSTEANWKKEEKEGRSSVSNEPISVLDTRSPSPSTSTSTLCGGGGGGSGSTVNTPNLAVVTDNTPNPGLLTDLGFTGGYGGGKKEDWGSDLQPIQPGLEDWDSFLSDSGQDQSLLRWISGEPDEGSFSLGPTSPPSFFPPSAAAANLANPKSGTPQTPFLGPSNGVIYQQPHVQITPDEKKPQIFMNPHLFMNQQHHSELTHCQNSFPPPFEDSLGVLEPHPKRQNLGGGGALNPRPQIPKVPFFDSGHDFLLRKHPPMVSGGGSQKQIVYNQLSTASELILAGNFPLAQGILARLNHHLSPVSKSFQRSVCYFKEALMSISNPIPPKTPTPFDAMFKMGAYKSLSENSPMVQFMNFTSNQALLEALEGAERIHVIDFDVGFGAQWASFIQELPGRIRGTPSLKITAFASPSTHHPLELTLMHENLTQLANEMCVNFELEIVNFDGFDPNSYLVPLSRPSGNEAIVVNFPIWVCSGRLPVLPSLIRLIKRLSPKVVVTMESGCERSDLPFSHHILSALQYYDVLLDSIDAGNVTSETVNKIEKFLLQPRIECIVLGRIQSPNQMPNWKTLFASAGYSPVAFSNFAETQAECIARRSHVGGFRVEKRQESLVMCWQQQEIVSASAWRC